MRPGDKHDAERRGREIKIIIETGKRATAYTKSQVKKGDTMHKYGRLLGYAYLSDGRMLNEEIVKAGYASLMTYPPNVRYEGRFLNAYGEASKSKRGLWR